jgi:hypothetical protein
MVRKEKQMRFPCVLTNGALPHCNFCNDVWGVEATLDYRFSHSEQEARAAGWLFCCGWCWAHVLYAPHSNLLSMKPQDYRGYRPQVKGDLR